MEAYNGACVRATNKVPMPPEYLASPKGLDWLDVHKLHTTQKVSQLVSLPDLARPSHSCRRACASGGLAQVPTTSSRLSPKRRLVVKVNRRQAKTAPPQSCFQHALVRLALQSFAKGGGF